jgi:ribosomal subunit interface protein
MSSFPPINLKAVNIELSPGLTSLVDQKLQPLEKLLPEGETDIRCEVELEKLTGQQTGRIYRAEVNLFVRGTLHRAEALEEQIEKAIDEVRDELRRELEKARKKRQSLIKRGGQVLKNMLRFGR